MSESGGEVGWGVGYSVAGMGKLDLFFSCGEEREDGRGVPGFSNGTNDILYMYRWKKMKMFSE